ncbi:MAG: hypothetical protein ACRC1H_09750 [Caldilineaceae bacterium]
MSSQPLHTPTRTVENTSAWPDTLQPPDPTRVASLVPSFWRTLDGLPDLVARGEWILAEELTAGLRRLVIEMMLAINGIAPPPGTRHLNGYLGASQRAVLERTLFAPSSDADSWVARAVALTVIQSWYAPQLAAHFGFPAPSELESAVHARLVAALPSWPLVITTDPPQNFATAKGAL